MELLDERGVDDAAAAGIPLAGGGGGGNHGDADADVVVVTSQMLQRLYSLAFGSVGVVVTAVQGDSSEIFTIEPEGYVGLHPTAWGPLPENGTKVGDDAVVVVAVVVTAWSLLSKLHPSA